MPGRVRRRRGRSAAVPKEDGTAMVVKQRVVHTYSRVNPRQTVNKHHFLTPDTPGILEEWELPSHLLRGSLDSSQLLSRISAQAGCSNSIERTEKMQQAKDPGPAEDGVAKGPGPAEDGVAKDPGPAEDGVAKDPGPPEDGMCAAAKRQKLHTSETSEEAISPVKGRKVKGKRKKAAVRRGRRRRKESSTSASANINPGAESQLLCVRITHQRNEGDQSTNDGAEKCSELEVREQGSGKECCHQTLGGNTTISGEGAGCNEQLQLQSAEDKMDASSCDLNLISMEMTCQTVVGPGIRESQSIQQLLPSADGTGVLLNMRCCDTTNSSACLDSTSRKVRYFLDTITADLQRTLGDLPHTLTPLSASAQSSSAGGSSKELTEPPTIASEPYSKHPLSVSSGTAQQESNSEDEIEVSRTRDLCGELDDPVNTENYLAERVPLEFSMSDHQWPERGDHALSECIADDELEGQLHNSVGKVVLQQNLSVDRKKTDCTELCLPRSAQERGNGAASGKNFTSCNNLEEHFSGLRMTPIVGRISPHLPTPPGNKAIAPLTSTPLAALGPGSSGTPWSLRGLVNLEHTQDLNQHTPFFNQGCTAYPLTSTPLHPTHHATSGRSNVRRGGTPSGSSVGTTMEKMLEFDEVGFDVSEVLDFGTPDKRTGDQREDFRFSQLFSSCGTNSQLGSSGKPWGARGRKGGGNVERNGESECKQPPTGSKRQVKNTKNEAPRRESRVQNRKKNFTSKPVAKSKSVVVPKSTEERERQSVKMRAGKRQSPKFIAKPVAKSKSVVVPKGTEERERQTLRMRAGKGQSPGFIAKPAVKSKPVVVSTGTEERERQSRTVKRRQSVIVPKSLRKQNRNCLPAKTSNHSSKSSTASFLRGNSHDGTITDMDTCPLCVLTQVSMEAAGQPHISPLAYTDESAPEDILTQQ